MNRGDVNVGGKTLSIETGKFATQASGAVIVRYGDTMVLVTACSGRCEKASIFSRSRSTTENTPRRRAGSPGGFFKREGRPTEMRC